MEKNPFFSFLFFYSYPYNYRKGLDDLDNHDGVVTHL